MEISSSFNDFFYFPPLFVVMFGDTLPATNKLHHHHHPDRHCPHTHLSNISSRTQSNSTWSFLAVSHPRTTLAICCLASAFDWELGFPPGPGTGNFLFYWKFTSGFYGCRQLKHQRMLTHISGSWVHFVAASWFDKKEIKDDEDKTMMTKDAELFMLR